MSVDHISLAVSDLDKAAMEMAKAGFTLKKPYVHKTGPQKGLTSQSIRLASGQYLQLIGPTRLKSGHSRKDGALAKWYQEFLKGAEGGVSLVIKHPNLKELEKKLNQKGLPCRLVKNKGYQWLSFKTGSAFQNVAFIFYTDPPQIFPELIKHSNQVTSIEKVTLLPQGDPKVWSQIFSTAGALNLGLEFSSGPLFKNPQIFISHIILRKLTGKDSPPFFIGKTKITTN